jgi:hypothetical protein
MMQMGLDSLDIFFEKHLFDSSTATVEELIDVVLEDYMAYLRNIQTIIRTKDSEIIKELIIEEIIELANNTIGNHRNIREFLNTFEALEEKRVETTRRYLELI